MNREKLKAITTYLKCMKPILLSHHPECEKFEKNHTINIGKYRFCIGCYVGYPSALIGIFVILFLNLVEIFNSFCFLITSLVLISTFVLSPLNLTRIKAIKIIQKFLIGLGAAFLFWYIFTLQNPFFLNFFYFILVFGFLIILLNVYHGYSFHKICKKCEYSMDWNNCPGFKKINECLEKHNLNFTFSTPEKIE
ncbi:MAG: hypothetical protein EU529_13425 [Promethearchaeota archaeon]|nr:MAG: hypothetical protein EU529_13425 [Candidatus Lokiarchaeota archaeon]